VRGGDKESYVQHRHPPKFENPFQDNVKKALFTRQPKHQESDSNPEQLDTAEKLKLKREMMMMGYDEDSYDQEEAGQYVVEDSEELTESQLFQQQKKAYAQQLKEELYGAKSKPVEYGSEG
jgi:hypothetical protein